MIKAEYKNEEKTMLIVKGKEHEIVDELVTILNFLEDLPKLKTKVLIKKLLYSYKNEVLRDENNILKGNENFEMVDGVENYDKS